MRSFDEAWNCMAWHLYVGEDNLACDYCLQARATVYCWRLKRACCATCHDDVIDQGGG